MRLSVRDVVEFVAGIPFAVGLGLMFIVLYPLMLLSYVYDRVADNVVLDTQWPKSLYSRLKRKENK